MIRSPESARDPAGAVVRYGDRVLRLVHAEGESNANAYLSSAAIQRHREQASCVATTVLPRNDWPSFDDTEDVALVLEHERVWFPSYPCEWTPGMLRAAALLTLELARDLSLEHRGLKDATPFNVLFQGSRPVFIDALSVEERDPADPFWFAYGQFVRTFVLPLIAARDLGWSIRHCFDGARDGLDPASLYARLSWPQRLGSPARGTVTGPVLLARTGITTALPPIERRRVDPERAQFVLRRILAQLSGAVDAALPRNVTSDWSNYSDPSIHPPEYHAARHACVADALGNARPRRVLDIGTNDGTFAILAASSGAAVVAIDRDEAVVDRAYHTAAAAGANVLSLVVDLTDPTPATGWRNAERTSFLERAAGQFDGVLCLAVLHHLVVGDGLALSEVISLLASLTTDLLLAEFVPASDPWCSKLARGRPLPAERWSEASFEREALRWFRIEQRHTAGLRGRTLFVLRRQSDAPTPL